MSKNKNKTKKPANTDTPDPAEFEDAKTPDTTVEDAKVDNLNEATTEATSEEVALQGEDLGKDQDQQANNQIPNEAIREQAEKDAEEEEKQPETAPLDSPDSDIIAPATNPYATALSAQADDNVGDGSNGGIHDADPSTQITEPDYSTPNATSTRASGTNDPAKPATPANHNVETKKKKSGKTADCPNCDGSGLTDPFTLCTNCDGTGTIKE